MKPGFYLATPPRSVYWFCQPTYSQDGAKYTKPAEASGAVTPAPLPQRPHRSNSLALPFLLKAARNFAILKAWFCEARLISTHRIPLNRFREDL